MRKSIAFILIAIFFLMACASTVTEVSTQTYRDNGLPAWVGETFTNPHGYWAGYNNEEGFYAWGEATYADRKTATNAAELDAKRRLTQFALGEPAVTIPGMSRVDRFIADDGTVYVLEFVSKRNVKKAKNNKL